MQAAMVQASLCICAGWPEPSLFDNVMSTEISCAGSNSFLVIKSGLAR